MLWCSKSIITGLSVGVRKLTEVFVFQYYYIWPVTFNVQWKMGFQKIHFPVNFTFWIVYSFVISLPAVQEMMQQILMK